MPNTSKGTPYVQSSDLVSAYPTTSLSLANHIDNNLSYNAATFQSNTGTTYTFALADASLGKIVTASNAAAQTYTVPPQTSIAWATGAVIRLVNIGAGAVTIVGGSGVTVSNALSTVAQWEGVNLIRTASDSWVVVRGGGLPKAVYSSATVAPSNTFTSGSTTTYVWKSTSQVTFSQAGILEILVVGGGGGGGNGANNSTYQPGGGGGGGVLSTTLAYVTGTITVTVGAGGAATNGIGTFSQCGDYYAPGGGSGGTSNNAPTLLIGASGGGGPGGGFVNTSGAAGMTGLGSAGGTGGGSSGNGAGGGGGAGAVGGNASGATAGAGGNGESVTILSTTDASTAAVGQVSGGLVYYGGGGGGYGVSANGAGGLGGGAGTTTLNGTANTGGGGRGNGGQGGSGCVVIKIG